MRALPLAGLAVLMAAAAPARAQELSQLDVRNLAFRGLGVWLFGVAPVRSEPAVALQVRSDLGELAPNLRINPSITFWATKFRGREVRRMEDRIEAACERSGTPCSGIDLGEIHVSDLSLDVDAQYLWTTSVGIEPYAGAGVGLHLVNGRGDFIDNTFVEDVLDAITPGVNVMGGLELPVGPNLRLQGEVRGVLASNARWVGAGFGASWTVPPPRRAAPAAGRAP